MKIKLILFLAAAVSCLSAGDITVYRKGRNAWIKSRFSEKYDIVIEIFNDANEKSYLVSPGSDIRKASHGLLLHSHTDEYPATFFKEYQFLGGNHGSIFARMITAKDHGFTMADSGKILTDSQNNRYVLVKVENKNQFIIHPFKKDPQSPIGSAVFVPHSRQKLYFNKKEIVFSASKVIQMRPLNAISRNEFLIDGKTPLPEDTVVRCNFLDHVFEHDVIAPEAAVEYIAKKSSAEIGAIFTTGVKMFYPQDHPEAADFAKLPALMQVKNRMRYQANGAMVNYRSCRYPYKLSGVNQLEVMFCWVSRISSGRYQKFYIPKTKPIVLPMRKNRKKKIRYDFVKGVDISGKPQYNGYLLPKNAQDPANLPDRFIRVSGQKSPEYGIALGYSMLYGATALDKRGALRSRCYHFWHTQKIYPYAYTLRDNEPGTTVDTVSYRQYFAPANDPDATAFYYHKQKDSTVVYFETHKMLKDKKLALPQKFTGRTFSVIEKTPSLTLLTAPGKIPAGGIRFDVKKDYGHLVLKID